MSRWAGAGDASHICEEIRPDYDWTHLSAVASSEESERVMRARNEETIS